MSVSIKVFVFAALLTIAPAVSFAGGHVPGNWIIKDSPHSVKSTADKLVMAIEAGPPKLFARVDHAAAAKSIGASLPDATMIMFGAPQIGTPIMQENIAAGLDLPIRVLIWDEGGQTKIGYVNPSEFNKRYGIKDAQKSLEGMAGAVGKLTDAATK